MDKATMTQREFAALAGLSTATVVSLIKSGELEKAPDGRIPSSELRKVILRHVSKYASNGSLFVTLGVSTDEQALAVIKFLEKQVDSGNTNLRLFSGVNDILLALTKPSENMFNENITAREYNKEVLSTFIASYKTAMNNYFISLISTKKYSELCDLPASLLYELVMYGRLLNADEETKEKLKGVAEPLKQMQIELNILFSNIMQELNMIKPALSRELLFDRVQITEGFLKKDVKDDLYNAFMGDLHKENGVIPLKGNDKIKKSMSIASKGKNIKLNLERLLRDGYYTPFNVTDEDSVIELLNLATSGAYGKLYFYADSVQDVRGFIPTLDSISPSLNNMCKIYLIPKEEN